MRKKGTTKRLQEISQVISKIKAVLAADDSSSPEFSSELQNLEKKYLDRLHQVLDAPQRKYNSIKGVGDGN